MCGVLKEIYREIYDEPFFYSNLENRIKLQKAVYLLENMGVYVGDYSFSWNTYGPYSLQLDSDSKRCDSMLEQEVAFSETAKRGFSKIKGYINEKVAYNCVNWIECIAALHYLKNIFKVPYEELNERLIEKKSYLNDVNSNEKAIEIISGIKVGV